MENLVKVGGGAAFPGMAFENEGMTLRDYFAGQALIGLLASEDAINPRGYERSYAKSAYALADAMLAAREE